MKSGLPALIMLLSEFWKPVEAGRRTKGRTIQSGRSFGIEPAPAIGEAGNFAQSMSRGALWARSKKKRFG